MELSPNVRVWGWVKKGCLLYLKNPLLVLGSALCAAAVSTATLGLLAGPMVGGVVLVLLRIRRANAVQESDSSSYEEIAQRDFDKPNLGDVFRGLDFLRPTLQFSVPMSLLMLFSFLALRYLGIIGLVIWVILAFLVSLVTVFVVPLIVDQGKDLFQALELSVRTVFASPVDFSLFWLLNVVIALAGALLFFVGFIFTMPIVFCTVVASYEDIFSVAPQK